MRSAGLPVNVLVEYMNLYRQGDETIEARIQLLMEQRAQLLARLEDIQRTLERLTYKIERYKQWHRSRTTSVVS